MDCRDFKELVPALALETLDESERAACVAHLAAVGHHDGCHQAEPQARALVARLAGVLPDHPVKPSVWHAIEQRVRASGPPRPATRRRPRWRELGGWVVAVAVFALYLQKGPLRASSFADAASASPPAFEHAAALMMDQEMRRYVFRPARGGSARGTLLLAPNRRKAVILIDRVAPPPAGHGLQLWAVRGSGVPAALVSRLDPTNTGIAIADLGAILFDPTLPGELLLSSDPANAAAPHSVLMIASLTP